MQCICVVHVYAGGVGTVYMCGTCMCSVHECIYLLYSRSFGYLECNTDRDPRDPSALSAENTGGDTKDHLRKVCL